MKYNKVEDIIYRGLQGLVVARWPEFDF